MRFEAQGRTLTQTQAQIFNDLFDLGRVSARENEEIARALAARGNDLEIFGKESRFPRHYHAFNFDGLAIRAADLAGAKQELLCVFVPLHTRADTSFGDAA